jgi:hypothetical protein
MSYLPSCREKVQSNLRTYTLCRLSNSVADGDVNRPGESGDFPI